LAKGGSVGQRRERWPEEGELVGGGSAGRRRRERRVKKERELVRGGSAD